MTTLTLDAKTSHPTIGYPSQDKKRDKDWEVKHSTNGDSSHPLKTRDPFRLGWRIKGHLKADGSLGWERIPLTMQDILHPQEGDFRIHNDEHKRMCVYLNNVLEIQSAHDPTAVVLHDTKVEWDDPELGGHGPDIALIFGVREHKKWGTFYVAEEGTRPTVIIEITSPETRHLDLDDKPDDYEQAGVEYYVIVDTYTNRRNPNYTLIGYHLADGRYEPMKADARGWLWIEPANIWIGLNHNTLACYDRQGNRIGTPVEINEAYIQSRAQAEQAEAKAKQAEARAEQAERRAENEARIRKELEEELRRLRSQSS